MSAPASAAAVSMPMPDVEPVTSAVLPSRSIIQGLFHGLDSPDPWDHPIDPTLPTDATVISINRSTHLYTSSFPVGRVRGRGTIQWDTLSPPIFLEPLLRWPWDNARGVNAVAELVKSCDLPARHDSSAREDLDALEHCRC